MVKYEFGNLNGFQAIVNIPFVKVDNAIEMRAM
jgi:hypothetical protein